MEIIYRMGLRINVGKEQLMTRNKNTTQKIIALIMEVKKLCHEYRRQMTLIEELNWNRMF